MLHRAFDCYNNFPMDIERQKQYTYRQGPTNHLYIIIIHYIQIHNCVLKQHIL